MKGTTMMTLDNSFATDSDYSDYIEAPNEPLMRETLIPALRSGEYQQAKHVLRSDMLDQSSFCCLGVFCDLIAPDRWNGASAYIPGRGPIGPIGASIDDLAFDDDGWLLGHTAVHRDALIVSVSILGEESMLPPLMQGAIGITGTGGFAIRPDARGDGIDWEIMPSSASSLASMNDSGFSFAHIADVIEYILDHPDLVMFVPVKRDYVDMAREAGLRD